MCMQPQTEQEASKRPGPGRKDAILARQTIVLCFGALRPVCICMLEAKDGRLKAWRPRLSLAGPKNQAHQTTAAYPDFTSFS